MQTFASDAIIDQNPHRMVKCFSIYRPETGIRFTTVSGATMPPLAFAIEHASYDFNRVLNVLVKKAGVDPSAPYIIEDQQVRIQTTALTQMLARWPRDRTSLCRDMVLTSLLHAKADPTAPALFQVTDIHTGELRESPNGSGSYSLLAYTMANRWPMRAPFHYVTDLMTYGARFMPSDPPGLLVLAAENLDLTVTDLVSNLEMVVTRPQAFMLLKPTPHGLDIDGLKRMAATIEPRSGMTLLHLYVETGCGYHAHSKLHCLRKMYGLSLLQPTANGQNITALANTVRSSDLYQEKMQTAVAELLEEEVVRWRALVMVQCLSRWLPTECIEHIGIGLPTRSALALHARIHAQRVMHL